MVSESKESSFLEFGGTDNGYGLWQHHLVGAVSVEVNTGEEGCLRGMSMNPAQCDETLLILYEEKLLFILGVAIVRPSALLGDENMGDGKLVPHQFSTENPTRLHSPGSVGTGQLEELRAELPRYHHMAQSIDCRSFQVVQCSRFQGSVHYWWLGKPHSCITV